MQLVASAPRSSGQSAPISALQAPGSHLHQKYHILEQIGEGGYASIYKACERENQRLFVAIKAINLEGMSADQIIDATATFNTELTILSSLKHPAIPTVYDHFTDASHWYLVMSFIEGQTLEQYFSTLTQNKYRDPQTVCTLLEIALELCNVLMYMHRQQPAVIYRDLKPANIMLGPRNHVTLIDFGIARHFKPGQSKDTIPFGSPGYAAPEQYGKAQTTPRSDIYSLGALLHQMLTGEDPSEHPFEFSAIHITTPGLPIELGSFIARMLALDPEQRPTSMLDVQQQLGKDHTALKAHLNQKVWSSAPAPVKPKIQRRTVLGLGALGLTALAAASLPTLLNRPSPQPAQDSTSTASNTTPVVIPELSKVETLSTWKLPSKVTATALADVNDAPYNIVGCTDNTIFVVLVDSSIKTRYTGHKRAASYISHMYTDTHVASCSENDTDVHIWDSNTGKLINQVHAPKTVVALSLYGDTLAIACTDNTVYTYDLTNSTPKPTRTYPAIRRVTALVLHTADSSNEKLYVSYADTTGTVQVWQEDQNVLTFGHNGICTALASWNNLLASAGTDQAVQVHDVIKGNQPMLYLGHQSNAKAVTWLNDNTVASLDERGEVHIWSITSEDITLLTHPLLTTRADPKYNMSAYITDSEYHLSCLTAPGSLTTYLIS